MTSIEEAAVFADTSVGTHIAMAVPSDITAGDFMRELEKTHLSCFPSFGKIRVYGLMVKRKSCFYYLPEQVSIKHVFKGICSAWFICADVGHSNGLSNSIVSAEVRHDVFYSNVVIDSCVTSNRRNLNLSSGIESRMKKPLTKELPRAASFPGITENNKKRMNCSETRLLEPEKASLEKKRAFSSFVSDCEIEASQCCSVPMVETSEVVRAADVCHRDATSTNDSRKCGLKSFAVRTPGRNFPFLSPTDYSKPREFRKIQRGNVVGKRILAASSNIRMYGKKQSPSISSICRMKNRRFLKQNTAASLGKYLVFEISDSED